MELNENLKKYRMASGLSQGQAANALGIARQSISRWETGQAVPTEENLAALARIYGVTVDELRYGEKRPAQEVSAGVKQTPDLKRRILLFVATVLVCVLIGAFLGWHLHEWRNEHSEVHEYRLDLSEQHNEFDIDEIGK